MKHENLNTSKTANSDLGAVSGSAMGWIIINKTQPLCKDAQYPIYWLKKVAVKDAEKFGGTVHKVWMTW